MTAGKHDPPPKKEQDAAKPLLWTHPFIHRVATSDVYNDSYTEIRDSWSTGELVEALRHIQYHEDIRRIRQPDNTP